MYRIFSTLISFLIIISFTGCDTNNVELKKDDYKFSEFKTTFIKKVTIEEKVKEKKLVIQEKKKIIKKSSHKPLSLVELKKKHFLDILVPITTSIYNKLEHQYQDIKRDLENNTANKEYIKVLKKRYKVDTDTELLAALKPHPISIALAQAATESAWLTSRFTKSANNIFGVWSFNNKEPRIAATGLRGDKTIYLKKYKNFRSAVEDYYFSIAKSWAYKQFRYLRVNTNNPAVLLPHLKSYSEKGDIYTTMLKKVIDYNNFQRFDIK